MKNQKEDFSILIPVYNFDVVALVKQLLIVSKKIGTDFEILLIDDASNVFFKEKNKIINNFENIRYIELNQNIGRSKIRNLLFLNANYEHCIILDCDIKLINDAFLELYFEKLTTNNVVVGGHIYKCKPPKDKSKYFHWLYGHKIEVKSLEKRLKNPYNAFMTNSFGISKTLFNKIKFDESLNEYGHEDTLFGIYLKNLKIPIIHIANPVLHLGLETEDKFLEKQEKAIQNLVQLYKKEQFNRVLKQNVKLIDFYNRIKDSSFKWFLIKLLMLFVKLPIIKQFDKMKLLDFSLWKLKQFRLKMSSLY